MEITLKDVESNLETLPEEFLYQVNDFIDFLKYKHLNDKQYVVPEWHKEEVRRRVKYSQEHPESFISESEMNDFLNSFERES
ncbi:hypothetical protein OMO38_11420 [Chryseobacterium sp. 09-1422]|uniref:DUF2281 domain-containing protein n=1 Tax=Chryseobacterium kimseyorum TaxID=2984028 RepID=A0ABT3HZA7_9FLAO|nr:hypothetical protein [Chryseobacterium kimseyorum]MCW3169129.1 hypothetical protein [Chryseobacterium kimseyorum]